MKSLRAPLLLSVALVMLCVPASADMPAACRVAESEVVTAFPLPRTAAAIVKKTLDVLVIGAGSSTLPGKDGAEKAYPARLQKALIEKYPGVTVNVQTDIKRSRTAAEMSTQLISLLGTAKPALVIWQTGTIDAMRAVDPDRFGANLDSGINAARAAGADVVLVNSQYSPRTESMIALGAYNESMRWVALQQELPLFDRFGIMRLWSEEGTFNFHSATKKLDTAERVHDCIGWLLATLVAEGVRLAAPPGGGR